MQWLKLEVKTIEMPVSATQTVATVESSSVPSKPEGTTAATTDEVDPMSRKVLFTRPVLLPLSIGLVLLIIQQVSGIDSIIFFTVEIFRASGMFAMWSHSVASTHLNIY